MAYYREEETRSAIENFVRWAGDGEPIRCGMSVLGVLRAEMTRPAGPVIPSLGIEAGRTELALERMAPNQARALLLYHGADSLMGTKARALGVSVRQVYRLLELAHPSFWAALDTIALESRQRAATDTRSRVEHERAKASASGAFTRPSADLPRIRRRRRKGRQA